MQQLRRHRGKGWRSAKKFRKSQISQFADFNNFFDCGPSANVALCGFAICGPIFLVICGLKTSASTLILCIFFLLAIIAYNAQIKIHA
jgi:uncharacterized membrane protein YphA (DoxX/SURF4 family)